MEKYDKRVAERVRVEKEAVNNVDEDGWKTVTKKCVFAIF